MDYVTSENMKTITEREITIAQLIRDFEEFNEIHFSKRQLKTKKNTFSSQKRKKWDFLKSTKGGEDYCKNFDPICPEMDTFIRSSIDYTDTSHKYMGAEKNYNRDFSEDAWSNDDSMCNMEGVITEDGIFFENNTRNKRIDMPKREYFANSASLVQNDRTNLESICRQRYQESSPLDLPCGKASQDLDLYHAFEPFIDKMVELLGTPNEAPFTDELINEKVQSKQRSTNSQISTLPHSETHEEYTKETENGNSESNQIEFNGKLTNEGMQSEQRSENSVTPTIRLNETPEVYIIQTGNYNPESNQLEFNEKLTHEEVQSKQRTLKVREKMNAGSKSHFRCEICSKLFNKGSDLETHSRIHTGEKPFQCSICFKSYKRASTLKSHVTLHSEAKPFQCGICLKSFNLKKVLETHSKIHTGERPFQCKVCLKSFSQSYSLKLHGITHTGEKRFSCDICKKSFTRIDNLRVHERLHLGEQPFRCKMCPKSFNRSDQLINHEKKTHTRNTDCVRKLCRHSLKSK